MMPTPFNHFRIVTGHSLRRRGDSGGCRGSASGCLPKAATSALWCLIGCLAGLALHVSAQPEVYGNPNSSAFIPIPKDADDWTRHFHIGALVGMNISASFNEKGLFNLSGNNAANGIYDDGYVRPDQNGDPNYTSYWGYNNRSLQYNAANQTLQMHSTTSYSATSSANAEGGPFPGFEMAYGDNLWYWKHARVGWELGFGWLPINISEISTTQESVNQNTYTFSTQPPGVGFPTITSYQGLPGGTGPILSTAFTQSTSNLNGTVTGTHALDVTLYSLRLGPTFYWDLTDHLGMSLGAGPAVGIVTGNYKYDESINAGGVSARNTGQIDGTKLVYGGYVNAALMYHVVDNGDIFVGAQYMPMSDASFGGGGREGRLNLGGQLYFTVGINWPF